MIRYCPASIGFRRSDFCPRILKIGLASEFRYRLSSNRKEVHLLDLRKFLPFSMILFISLPRKALNDSPKLIIEKKMILRAGIKNNREIQRFRPKRFINTASKPQLSNWESARALTLTERLQGICSTITAEDLNSCVNFYFPVL